MANRQSFMQRSNEPIRSSWEQFWCQELDDNYLKTQVLFSRDNCPVVRKEVCASSVANIFSTFRNPLELGIDELSIMFVK
jgi:hypothetical protein